jgi:hypothetical protein
VLLSSISCWPLIQLFEYGPCIPAKLEPGTLGRAGAVWAGPPTPYQALTPDTELVVCSRLANEDLLTRIVMSRDCYGIRGVRHPDGTSRLIAQLYIEFAVIPPIYISNENAAYGMVSLPLL